MIADRLDIKPGDFLDGKYHVVKKVGSGSYGDVFKVKDSHGNVYALKLLHLWDIISELREELIKKFEQEYKTAQIASKYLVHSIDHGIIRGNPYLVMEFCQNGDLDNLKQKDTNKVARIARDILEGLHALHSEGMVHRDLKPANVLIKGDGTAALTDFGTIGFRDVKRQSSKKFLSSRPKDMTGTPLYMSPEVVDRKGGGVTYLPTVDIFSFGVMMYELITDGSLPFGNIDKIEDLPSYQKNAKNGKWDSNRLKASPFGKDWLYIIERCIASNYQERYQSALEVLQDMKPMIGNVESHQERLSRSTTLTRLLITQGDNLGATYTLSRFLTNQGRMLRVGRELHNDIVLPENNSTYLSRYHFTLERSKDGLFWVIKDGQWQKNERRWVTSTNGTYLNATPVTQEGLKVFTGDIITAGEYKIKVE